MYDTLPTQGCRKAVKSGGGNISDYVLLIVSYTSRGSGGMPPKKFWYFCAEIQLLVQSDAKICLTVVS